MIATPSRRPQSPSAAPKKRSRKEILRIAQAMADELVARAEGAPRNHGDRGNHSKSSESSDRSEIQAFLRSAQLLRELVSIAQGQRSAAYWTDRPRATAPAPTLSKAFPSPTAISLR